MSSTLAGSDRLLRRALLANAAFSGLSALLLLTGFSYLGEALGIPGGSLAAVGASLALFSFWLLRNAWRPVVDRREAGVAVGLDAAWVIGSVVVLAAPPAGLTAAGWWAIALVADIVAAFAALQLYGLRRSAATA